MIMTNDKLIVKNTVFMAVRMVITMAISLYTSRVVLAQLGITDYGIFIVVAGLTVIMSFFTSALTAAIQRYMNFELGLTGGRGMQQIFAACWVCVVLIAILFVGLAETGGMWFLGSELDIPAGRMADARMVLHMSMLIVVVEMCRVPYNSLIIAHERMSFYAYNSIVESLLKLLAVIALSLICGDKLIVYMGLLIVVSFLINASYIVYCRHYFPGIRFSLRANVAKVKEIGKFAGWNVLTSISDIAYQQGSSMILNIFYGVGFNATMGISNQVKTAVASFTRSVQIAANPQIVKSYASGDSISFKRLITIISRISYFAVLFLGMPILVNTEFVLNLWLTELPPDAVIFVRLMVVFCLLDSLIGPLWVSMQASGRIAGYQSVISVLWILCLPLIYVAFRHGLPPYWLLVVLIGINFVSLWIRIGFTSHYCGMQVSYYGKKVLFPIVVVTFVCCVALWPVVRHVVDPMRLFVISSVVWVAVCPVAVYFLALSRYERQGVKRVVGKYFNNKAYEA